MTAIEDARALRAALDDNANYGDAGQFYPGLDKVEEVLDALIAEHERVIADRDEWKRLFSECHPVHMDGVRRAALAERELERLTTPPTDDECEALYDGAWRAISGRDEPWGGCAEREKVMRVAEFAAGFRRQGPITDEWEYGAVYLANNGVELMWFSMDGAFTIREAAERDVERYNDEQIVLGRRRKAGPWEPVEAGERAR